MPFTFALLTQIRPSTHTYFVACQRPSRACTGWPVLRACLRACDAVGQGLEGSFGSPLILAFSLCRFKLRFGKLSELKEVRIDAL
jgi:hypothetical protein